MKSTFRMQMIFWIWGLTTILFAFILYVHFSYAVADIKKDLESNAVNLSRYYGKRIDDQFSRAAAVPEMLAAYIDTSSKIEDDESLKNYMKRALRQNSKFIYGTAIAFEPGVLKPAGSSFAPYFYQHEGKELFVQLGTQEGYNFTGQEWYVRPKTVNRPVWSEPYYDEGGGNTIMTTYSVPFYYEGKFAGVATADISLETLSKELNAVKLLETGYCFVITRQGNLISFPDKEKLSTRNLKDLNSELAREMIQRKRGFVVTHDPHWKERSWIFYSSMNAADFAIGFVYPEDEAMESIYDLGHRTFYIGFTGLLILLGVIILVAGSITRPLSQLVVGVTQISSGDLDKKIPLHTRTVEVDALGNAFNRMTDDLKKHIEEIRTISIEKERIASELELAKDIQLSVCPKKFPAFPNRKNIDIFAKMLPAREVGGDFYDFFELDEDRIGLVIGDTSGKGIPAALFTMMSQAFLKSTALRGLDPGKCLEFVNNLLCEENEQMMFVTVFYGILNTRTGEFAFSNGGHNPPCRLLRDGSVEPVDCKGGVALGVMEDVQYETKYLMIDRGIFLYTDGVTEAMNTSEQCFSFETLVDMLTYLKIASATEIVNRVSVEVANFAGDAPQSDDITMLAVIRPLKSSETDNTSIEG